MLMGCQMVSVKKSVSNCGLLWPSRLQPLAHVVAQHAAKLLPRRGDAAHHPGGNLRHCQRRARQSLMFLISTRTSTRMWSHVLPVRRHPRSPESMIENRGRQGRRRGQQPKVLQLGLLMPVMWCSLSMMLMSQQLPMQLVQPITTPVGVLRREHVSRLQGTGKLPHLHLMEVMVRYTVIRRVQMLAILLVSVSLRRQTPILPSYWLAILSVLVMLRFQAVGLLGRLATAAIQLSRLLVLRQRLTQRTPA